MPRNYKPKEKLFTVFSIESAIDDINNGLSIRKAAVKYNMSFSSLQLKFKKGLQAPDGRVSLDNYDILLL